VSNNASFLSAVQVDGPTLLKSTLNVSNNASFLSAIQVDGPTLLKSTLNVSNNASFLSAVQIDGAATLNSTLNVSGDAIFNNVNVTSLLINGLPVGSGGMGSNIYWNVYSIPDTTVDYVLSNVNRNTLLNVSYIAPVSGFYQVDAYLNLTTNTRTTWKTYLQTNNTTNVSCVYISPFVKSSYFTQNITEVIKLNETERVDIHVVCDSNVSLTTNGSKFRTTLVGVA
jgi:flagellar assembly factor FliW